MNNIPYIAIGLGLLFFAIGTCIGYLDKMKKINFQEWLKYAVALAEKELGSGTGQLKLHMVYDMAAKEFPWIVKVVPFDTFSFWVDEALEWLNHQLDNNDAVKNYIEK